MQYARAYACVKTVWLSEIILVRKLVFNWRLHLTWEIKPLFGFFFPYSSLLNQFSSLITHHLKYPNSLHEVCLAPSLVITQNFQLFVGPIPVTWCSFYSFFFFLQPPIPKLIEPSEKKKNQKPKLTEPSERRRRRRRRKKKKSPKTWTQWKKKEKKKK